MSHDDADLVAKVAEALWSVDRPPMWRYIADNHPKTAENTRRTARAVLDALDLPGRERRAKAEALREAADIARPTRTIGRYHEESAEIDAREWVAEMLLDRAAEIDPEEGDHE